MSELNLLQYCDDGKEYEVSYRNGETEIGKFKENSNNTFVVIFGDRSYTYKGTIWSNGIDNKDIISVKPVIVEQPKEPEMKAETPNNDLSFDSDDRVYIESSKPAVILEVEKQWDYFLQAMNTLQSKARKIKSLKSLKILTDKIKEL